MKANLCRECFIETYVPSAYDIEHIVMSKNNNFCKVCMNYAPYVDHIDDGDKIYTPRAKDFVLAVGYRRRFGLKVACVECGAIFEDDDFAFTHETGLCQYCHEAVDAIWAR